MKFQLRPNVAILLSNQFDTLVTDRSNSQNSFIFFIRCVSCCLLSLQTLNLNIWQVGSPEATANPCQARIVDKFIRYGRSRRWQVIDWRKWSTIEESQFKWSQYKIFGRFATVLWFQKFQGNQRIRFPCGFHKSQLPHRKQNPNRQGSWIRSSPAVSMLNIDLTIANGRVILISYDWKEKNISISLKSAQISSCDWR